MKLVVYQDTFIYLVPAFIVIRLYFCAFMAMYVFFTCHFFAIFLIPAFYPSLNTRDNLRATLDRQEIVLGTIPRFRVSDTPGTCGVPVTAELSSNAAVSKILPPIQVSSYASSSGSIALDREKYPVSPVPASLTGTDKE
jgi:hypothetical protein